MPKASIIITTHDRPHLLPRSVASARAAGTEVEIVVVDDASSDETARVCQTLAEIKYVRTDRNQRVAGARNIGLVASSGEFLSFLDDDDIRLPGSLDRQIEALESAPTAAMIYGQAQIREPDADSEAPQQSYPAECHQGDIFWRLLSRNFIPCGTVVFRRNCLSRIGLLDDTIPGLDDWDLWVRFSEIYFIIASPTPIVIWRRSTPASNQGTSQAAHLVSLSVRQFHKWMNLPRAIEASPDTLRNVWRDFSENMAEHLIWESARALRRGLVLQPLKNLSVLPRLHPLTLARITRNRVLPASWFAESENGMIPNRDQIKH